MAINTQKLLPLLSKKGSLAKINRSIVKADSSELVPNKSRKNREFSNTIENISKYSSSLFISQKSQDDISFIKVKVIEIDKILKGNLELKKKNLNNRKRKESQKRRDELETKLETKPKAEKGKIGIPKIPRMGFLDWVKNFIANVILGYFAVRLIDQLPKLKGIISFIGKATDFVINFGGKLLNGLVTFIDWGYKAYDATRGFLKNLGGENFVKIFDAFSGAIGTLIDTAIITATVLGTQGDGGVLDIAMDMLTDRLFGTGAAAAEGAAGTAAGTAGGTAAGAAEGAVGGAAGAAGLGAAAVAAVVSGAGLLSSALGEGAFQLRKLATKPLEEAKIAFNKERNPIVKIARGAQLAGMYATLGPLSAIGVLLDVVGAPFRYAIELIRFPFLNQEDKKKQAFNLAKLDSRIREDFRKALNIVTFGFAFKEKGMFGNIYGNKNAQKEMMSKMYGGGSVSSKKYIKVVGGGTVNKILISPNAPIKSRKNIPGMKYASGGVTRSGKLQGKVSRTVGQIKKRKYKRIVAKKPSEIEIKPGADVGGENKILGLFPNPLKMIQGAAQKVNEVINPFKVIENAGKTLGKSDYFGPILAVTSKILLGQKPEQKDYENVGLGINLLVSKGIDDGKLKGGIAAAFAEGGLVDPKALDAMSEGSDISDWVAKAFKESTETNAQKTLREIQNNLRLKTDQKEEPSSEDGGGGEEDGGGPSEGGIMGTGVTKGVSIAKKLMVDLKISPAAAAGIVGNLLHESGGLKPDNVEDGKGFEDGAINNIPVGTQRVGYGWAQWTNDRLENFRKFLKQRKADNRPATDNDNYAYLIHELTTTEPIRGHWKGWGGKNIPEDDPKRAATWFMMNWERPSAPHEDSRHDYAAKVFDKIRGLSREQAKAEVEKSGGKIYSGESEGESGSIVSDGKFIQGNSGASRGVHFHIGPGNQTKGTILQPRYNADARASALKSLLYFSGKRSVYLGRSGVSIPKNKKISSAEGSKLISNEQRAHTASGSQGGIDLQVDFESKVPFPLKISGMKYRPNGFGVSADIVGSNSFVAHGRYDEKGKIAPQESLKLYEKGGLTLGRPHLAIIGEKGKEFVIDADSTEAIQQTFPGFLDSLNKAKYKDAINVLRNFASYESGAEQTVVVFPPQQDQDQEPYDSNFSSMPGSSGMFVGGSDGYDPFDSLYVGW